MMGDWRPGATCDATVALTPHMGGDALLGGHVTVMHGAAIWREIAPIKIDGRSNVHEAEIVGAPHGVARGIA